MKKTFTPKPEFFQVNRPSIVRKEVPPTGFGWFCWVWVPAKSSLAAASPPSTPARLFLPAKWQQTHKPMTAVDGPPAEPGLPVSFRLAPDPKSPTGVVAVHVTVSQAQGLPRRGQGLFSREKTLPQSQGCRGGSGGTPRQQLKCMKLMAMCYLPRVYAMTPVGLCVCKPGGPPRRSTAPGAWVWVPARAPESLGYCLWMASFSWGRVGQMGDPGVLKGILVDVFYMRLSLY